jgi:hypothetical protein
MFLAYRHQNYLIIAFSSRINKGKILLFDKNKVIYTVTVKNQEFVKIPLQEIAGQKVTKITFKTSNKQSSKPLFL